MAKLSDVNGYGLAAAKPASPTEGYQYYETDNLDLVRYNGSTWDSIASIVTPTGAPALPWWYGGHNNSRISNATLDGGTIVAIGDGMTNPVASGSADQDLASGTQVLNCGGQVYKTTPTLNAFYGYSLDIKSYDPFRTWAQMKLTDSYHRWEMATQAAITSYSGFFGFTSGATAPNEGWQRGLHLHTSTHDAQIYIGHLGFKVKEGTDTNWQVAGAYNGAPLGSNWQAQEQDTGVAFTANTVYILEAVRNAAGAEWLFYINGSLVATVADTLASPFHVDNPDTGGPKSYDGFMLHTAGPSEIRYEHARWCAFGRQAGMLGFAGSW